MMKNKKILILIIIIIILAIIFSFFKIRKSYLFNDDNSVTDGKTELINRLEKIDDKEERKKQIDYSVEKKIITQKEADELY